MSADHTQSEQKFPIKNWTPPEEIWDDPVAQLTSWTPCSPGGNSKSNLERRLTIVNDYRMEWRTPSTAFLYHGCVVFPFLSCISSMFVGGLFSFWLFPNESVGMRLIFTVISIPCALLFGLAFASALLKTWPTMIRRVVFDQRRGYSMGWGHAVTSWTKRGSARQIKASSARKGYLEDIYAIQILAEESAYSQRTRDHEGNVTSSQCIGYKGYELNLVLDSGGRVNVVDHSDGISIRDEAAQLAKFLAVPLWDDSERGIWKFESDIKPTGSSGGALLKMMWLGITRQYEQMGSWIWARDDMFQCNDD